MTKAMPIGHRRIDQVYGYSWIKVFDHPKFKDGWVKEHHLVWWKFKKRLVPPGYVLHHKDENRLNNRITNLVLMTRKDHAILHHVGRKVSTDVRKKMSDSAKVRCTIEWRKAVSRRVKLQHKQGKFGRYPKSTYPGV